MKSVFKHPLFVTIFGGIVASTVAASLVAYINSISIYKSLTKVYNFTADILIASLTYRIPVWVIILLIIGCVLVLYLYAKFTEVKEQTPTVRTYTEDVIEDVNWVWDWYLGSNGYGLRHNTPVPLCTGCNANLIVDSSNYRFDVLVCENCGYKKRLPSDFEAYHGKIKREIFRRARNKYENKQQT